MKMIVAVIQPHKLDEVKVALSKQDVTRLTVSDAQGFGQQKGYREVYRGTEFTVNLIRKVRLEIAVNDEFVEPTVQAIIQSARSDGGKIGDGKIFIMPLEEVIRIRTGDRGGGAI